MLGICLLSVFLLILYVGLNTRGSFRFEERPGFMTYGMLAEAFVSGQLHLKQEVDQNRLRSPDPLDPSTPYPYWFDLIIWDGKYYVPREPLPGLIRALILYVIGLPLHTGEVIITFAFGSFLLLGLVLWSIINRFLPESPDWMIWYFWVAFGVSGTQLYIVGRPVVYHESDATACFFLLAGCALLIRGLSSARHNLTIASLSGTCFGLAVGCRALLILYPVCLVLMLLAFALAQRQSLKTTVAWAIFFSGPVAAGVALLWAYNYLRFGNPLEFGYTHVIVPTYSAYVYLTLGENLFSWKHVPYHFYQYLISLPLVVSKFPYLRYPFESSWVDDVYLTREAVCSMFITMPVLVMLLPIMYLFKHPQTKNELKPVLSFFLVSPLVVFVMLSAFYGASARYYYEFVPMLFVVAFCNLAMLWNRVTTTPWSKVATVAILSFLFFGNLAMGFILGYTGAVQSY